jgi:hypothetical protein
MIYDITTLHKYSIDDCDVSSQESLLRVLIFSEKSSADSPRELKTNPKK